MKDMNLPLPKLSENTGFCRPTFFLVNDFVLYTGKWGSAKTRISTNLPGVQVWIGTVFLKTISLVSIRMKYISEFFEDF